MPVHTDYSLVPYDPLRLPAGSGQSPARMGAGVSHPQSGPTRERAPGRAAIPQTAFAFGGTYSARRTLESPRSLATGQVVDIFV
jgi:hypothetical protein